MKCSIAFLLCLFFITSVQAQVSFEKGYIINSQGQKIECLIKSPDWQNSPKTISYKLIGEENINQGDVNSIKEFMVNDGAKYISAEVELDDASMDISKATYEKEPGFHSEKVFLKVIVEGDANLYLYRNGNLIKYVFSTKDVGLTQLVYKPYKTDGAVAYNTKYKEQLVQYVNCGPNTVSKLENLAYENADLRKYFVAYNTCKDSKSAYVEKSKSLELNLAIKARVNPSSLEIDLPGSDYSYQDFGSKVTWGAGLELELVLPFNKNKWAVIFDPNYQYFNVDVTTYTAPNPLAGTYISKEVTYKAVNLPLGVRYYMFLDSKSKLFINGAYAFNKAFGSSSIKFFKADGKSDDLDVKSSNNWMLGLGYSYNSKFTAEVRYQSNINILHNYVAWKSDFKMPISLVVGFRPF